jgi:stage III sporulation protein AF
MSAVEIIAPDNSMKKYIKFVLGLILISIMINPIVYLFTKGEQEIVTTIKNYENSLSDDLGSNTGERTSDDREVAFKENLNKNCEKLLSEEFSNREFKSEIECSVDFENMSYSIEKVKIGVEDKGIKVIEKIRINKNESTETISSDDNIEGKEEIKSYLSKVLNISQEKIDIYKLEG